MLYPNKNVWIFIFLFGYNIFGVHLFYWKPCYNESCYKDVPIDVPCKFLAYVVKLTEGFKLAVKEENVAQ